MKTLTAIYNLIVTAAFLLITMHLISTKSPTFVICLQFILCMMSILCLCKCTAENYEPNTSTPEKDSFESA